MNTGTIRKLQEECLRVLSAKNADYGTKNISKTGVEGLAVRLIDKAERILNVCRKGGTVAVTEETVRNTFLDIANYGLIGMSVCDGTWEQPNVSTMVYLAGPIDSVGGNSSKDAVLWRAKAADELSKVGVAIFNPALAYTLPGAPTDLNSVALRKINRSAVDACDAVLVFLPSGVTSIGTIREIEYGVSKGKPVLVVCDGWMERAKGQAELKDCLLFRDLNEALTQLAAMYITGNFGVTPNGT